MEGRKYPVPTWIWEFRSRTMSFLKYRKDFQEAFNEYVRQKTSPRCKDIERFIEVYSSSSKKKIKP